MWQSTEIGFTISASEGFQLLNPCMEFQTFLLFLWLINLIVGPTKSLSFNKIIILTPSVQKNTSLLCHEKFYYFIIFAFYLPLIVDSFV